jgi:hypothetical protein
MESLSVGNNETEVIHMAKPEKSFKCGGCEAAVFENEIAKGGTKIPIKKVSFQKRYKNVDGEWKSTGSLDVNEIPKAILVLTKAYDYVCTRSEDSVSDSDE